MILYYIIDFFYYKSKVKFVFNLLLTCLSSQIFSVERRSKINISRKSTLSFLCKLIETNDASSHKSISLNSIHLEANTLLVN